MKRGQTKKHRKSLFVLLILAIAAAAYSPSLVSSKDTFKIAVLPESLPIVIYESLNPLIEELKNELDANFELVISESCDDHLQMIQNGTVDFSYQNPYVCIELWSHIRPLVIAEKGKKWGIESRGVIISKANGNIHKPDDLIGKHVSIVSFHSADGFIAQRNLLKGMMINIGTDYQISETNSNIHQNVITDVLEGTADAGFLCENEMIKFSKDNTYSKNERKSIKTIAKTSYIPNWVFIARKNLKSGMVKKMKEFLLDIPIDSDVLKAASIRRFVQIPSNYLEEYRSKNQ